MGDPSTIIAKAIITVVPSLIELVKALKAAHKALKAAHTNDPNRQAQIVPIVLQRKRITEVVDKAKGVLDKWQDLDLANRLTEKLIEAEICRDVINYLFKNKGNIEWKGIIELVDKLLGPLEDLTRELSKQSTTKDKHPESHPSGHEMPPGNVRRCLLYLSRFPKGTVFNRNRITRLSVTHEFIAGDSGMPPLQQLGNFLQVVEHSCDGDGPANHFLVRDDVAEQISKWPERKYFDREALPESKETIKDVTILSSLNYLGRRNLTLDLKEWEFWYLKNLSLRKITLKTEKPLKKLSLLQYLDLKHTKVKGCDWLEGLEDLEMLDLRYTGVEEIPEKYLQKLGKLQHLLLGYPPKENSHRLAGAILNTDKLMTKNLKTLRAIKLPKEIKRIDGVSKVADLSVTGLKTEELKSFWELVEKFENLTSLGMAMTKDFEITLQDCPAKLKVKLRRLRMEGKFSNGSNSAQPHSRLAELGNFKELIDLTLASHEPINIDSIPKLSKLFCLRLYSFCRENTLILKIQGFERLKKLVIGDMAEVKTVQIASDVIESDVIKRVKTLKLCGLPNFRELIYLDSNSQTHLLRRKKSKKEPPTKETKPRFYKLDDQETKTIFLRGFENINFEKSPRLKIYNYDMDKQCYQEVPVVPGTNNQS